MCSLMAKFGADYQSSVVMRYVFGRQKKAKLHAGGQSIRNCKNLLIGEVAALPTLAVISKKGAKKRP